MTGMHVICEGGPGDDIISMAVILVVKRDHFPGGKR